MTAARPVLLLDHDEVLARCSPARAVEAVERVLGEGLDPAGDIPRVATELEHGHLLLMASGARGAFRVPGVPYVGVKVAAVAPHNPAKGLPRIQASYLLLDAETLTPAAVLDGTALTTLRTPAVSVAAVRRHLLRSDAPLSGVVIGSGPQALGHAAALTASVGAQRPLAFTFLVRDTQRASRQFDGTHQVARLGSPEADRALRDAGVVVCATSAREPVLGSDQVAGDVVVVAVGSHEPDVREVDSALCARSTVVVEDSATALREAGDVVLAVADGALSPADLVSLRDVVTGTADVPQSRPLLFKSVGMSWEDLVVASAVLGGHR